MDVDQDISHVIVVPPQDDHGGLRYDVGADGITRIEPYGEDAEYSRIPYLRVWRGQDVVAEFSKHKCFGVFYGTGHFSPSPALT